MKTIKVLTMGFMLFWAASVNFVAAQEEAAGNDSIYGLEVSITDHVMDLSFYSTYEKNNRNFIYIDVYDKATNLLFETIEIVNIYMSEEERDTFFILPPMFDGGHGEAYFIDDDESGFKIGINDRNLNNDLKNTALKIEVYITEERYIPLDNNLRAGVIGRSNVLTFFYDPQATSLIERINDENYIYKYYLLPSGTESKESPLGVPFVKVTYIDKNIISTTKYLTVR